VKSVLAASTAVQCWEIATNRTDDCENQLVKPQHNKRSLQVDWNL